MNREDFPILSRLVYGKPLIYLDNAATTQKPRCVVEAMTAEYYDVNANVHRGVHYLSQRATDLHEASRETVRKFINADSTDEIIFTRGTTESINLVATSLGAKLGQQRTISPTESDGENKYEVIISALEHHSNIVSWQLAGFKVRVIPIDDDCLLDLEAMQSLFNERTKIVSCTHVSNVTGVVNPVKDIIRIAHEHGVPVLVDAAQSTPHHKIDIKTLDCDFLAFSGHKIYGPTGIGVLYGKREILESMPPYMGGGEMIKNVSFDKTSFNVLPFKFEAGTPDYVATTGLAAALDYVNEIGMDTIEAHELELTRYAQEQMLNIDGLTIYGLPKEYQNSTAQSGVISFNVDGIHHLDIGTLLDRCGVAVRTGHHCAEPLIHRLGIEGTVRASFALYNTKEEVDVFINSLQRVLGMLR